MWKWKVVAAIAMAGFFCSRASADTVQFDFTFNTFASGFFDASGVLTATGTPGDYTVTGASGTAVFSGEMPFTILGPYSNPDNKIFYPNTPYLSGDGLWLSVSQLNSDFVENYYFNNGYAARLGDNELPGTFTLTPLNATPLPSAALLFATGLAALGFLGLAQKQSRRTPKFRYAEI